MELHSVANTCGKADAGNVNIIATDTVSLDGIDSNEIATCVRSDLLGDKL